MFFIFLVLSHSFDFDKAKVIDVPDCTANFEINSTFFENFDYLIRGFNSSLSIIGDKMKARSIFIEGTLQVTFYSRNPCSYSFVDLMTNETFNFVGSIQSLFVTETLKFNEKSLQRILELTQNKLPKSYEVVFLDPINSIAVGSKLVQFSSAGKIRTLYVSKESTVENYVKITVLAPCNNINSRIILTTVIDDYGEIFALPDIKFFGEGDGNVLVLGTWLNKKINSKAHCLISNNDFPQNNLTMLYETEEVIMSDNIKLEANNHITYTSVFRGEYFIRARNDILYEMQYGLYLDTPPGLRLLHELHPYNDSLNIRAAGYTQSNTNLNLYSLKNTNVNICGHQTLNYVSIEDSTIKSLKMQNTSIELRNSKVTDIIEVDESSSLYLIGSNVVSSKIVNAVGDFYLYGVSLDAEQVFIHRKCFTMPFIKMLTNFPKKRILEVDFEKGECNINKMEWSDDSFIMEFEDKETLEVPFSQFTELKFHFEDYIDFYQTKLIFSGKNNQRIENKFNFIIEGAKSPIILVGSSFYFKKPQVEISFESEKEFIVKTEGDFSPESLISFKNSKKISETKGKYCVIESGLEFEGCTNEEERIISKKETQIRHRFAYKKEGVFPISVKVLVDCNFASKSLENTSAKFFGANKSVVIQQESEKSEMEFINLSVKFICKGELSMKKLSFIGTEDVDLGTDSIFISNSLKAPLAVLEKMIPIMKENKNLIISALFTEKGKQLNMFQDKIELKTEQRIIEFPFSKAKHIDFYIFGFANEKENSLEINIRVPPKTLIYHVFDIFANSKDSFISFPTYIGTEFYQTEEFKCDLSSFDNANTKWHILSNSSLIPSSLFHFDNETTFNTNERGALFIYRNELFLKKCPSTHRALKINKTLSVKEAGDFPTYNILVTETTKENPLLLDSFLFKDKVVFIKGMEKAQFVKLTTENLCEVVLENVNVLCETETINVKEITLNSAKFDKKVKIKANKVYTDINGFRQIQQNLEKGTKIELNADNAKNLQISSESICFNDICLNSSYYESILLVYSSKSYVYSPLQISFNGNKGEKIKKLPEFRFNFLGEVYIHFTSSWKEKEVTADNKALLKTQDEYKVYITSDYLSYPKEVFSAPNSVFTNIDIVKYCLIPDSSFNISCPESYKPITYSEALVNETFKEMQNSQGVEFITVGSTAKKYPKIPEEIFNHHQIIFRGIGNENEYIETSFKTIDSLTLIKTHLFINSANRITMRNLQISDNTSTIESVAKLNPETIILNHPHDEIMKYLTKGDKRTLHLTVASTNRISTICFREGNIDLIYNKNVISSINESLFDDAVLFLSPHNLFINYIGNDSIKFGPKIVFKESENSVKVTFSDRWRYVTSLEENKESWVHNIKNKGMLTKPPFNDISIVSEYPKLPSAVFSIPDDYKVTYPTAGKYCIYSSSVSYSWKKCPEDAIKHVADDIVQASFLEPDENNFVEILAASDFSITASILSFKAFIKNIGSAKKNIVIKGENTGGGQLKLESVDCEFSFTGKNCFLDKLTLKDSTVKKAPNSFTLAVRRCEGELEDIERSQISFSNENQSSALITYSRNIEKNIIISLGEAKLMINDHELRYSQLGAITISLKDVEATLTADIMAQRVISIKTNGNVALYFDQNTYAMMTTETGVIQRVSGNLFLHSKFLWPPNVFLIPKESEHVFYEFGPKRTPLPTRAPSRTKFPQITPRPTIRYIDDIDEDRTLSLFGLSKVRSYIVVAIAFVITLILLFVVYLLVMWKRYTRFQRDDTTELKSTGTGILDTFY